MADGGGGECCIARWGGGGHVAANGSYNKTSKMDMIMLKFRPIAPKPVSGTTPASEGGSGNQKSDLTLLPLFPEAPDLSPTGAQHTLLA
uniref:Uncharacterized protein n=1 Tax=Chenopodium quinoa TaxID=63459 RepID=A0A803MG39_CHEQI